MAYGHSTDVGRIENIPAHVPAELVVDFDFFNPPGATQDPHLAWKRLHDGPDVIYTPYYGGHWIATRSDDMFAVMQNHSTFSNAEFTVPKRGSGSPLQIPIQLDPPQHGPIRSIALRSLSPKAMEHALPMIRALTAARVQKLVPRGRCEFVSDFTDVPVEIFLDHTQVPKDQIVMLKNMASTVARTDNEEERNHARDEVSKYLAGVLDERRVKLGDDLFSTIIVAEKEGRLSAEESHSLALNIFFGGLETVASALAFVVLFLARNPGHRQQLIDDPSLSGDATEELLRRFGVLNLARIATERTTFKGVTIEKGEQILLPLHLSSLDERKIPDALTVDFHRKRAAHYNFGTGPHRCLGSNLARPEIRIFIEEWLKYIPDFSVDPEDEPIGRSGTAMTMTHVPLVWPSR